MTNHISQKQGTSQEKFMATLIHSCGISCISYLILFNDMYGDFLELLLNEKERILTVFKFNDTKLNLIVCFSFLSSYMIS